MYKIVIITLPDPIEIFTFFGLSYIQFRCFNHYFLFFKWAIIPLLIISEINLKRIWNQKRLLFPIKKYIYWKIMCIFFIALESPMVPRLTSSLLNSLRIYVIWIGKKDSYLTRSFNSIKEFFAI